ncbi:hypothetical protein H6G89_02725 [Oscillatoria sp. FACHB-1407]|uniref:hypothetical protein n=1 Tax=Oscillatoria sp. FACHB-1407 TaxID=2692847 RepID=UPI0016892279|nr:hypothetical protein [Oscillatoria sp. FACHB-1407]MBD2459949.1 hypothetical protein [Oscillatoria sp. FACHB-1407]
MHLSDQQSRRLISTLILVMLIAFIFGRKSEILTITLVGLAFLFINKPNFQRLVQEPILESQKKKIVQRLNTTFVISVLLYVSSPLTVGVFELITSLRPSFATGTYEYNDLVFVQTLHSIQFSLWLLQLYWLWLSRQGKFLFKLLKNVWITRFFWTLSVFIDVIWSFYHFSNK